MIKLSSLRARLAAVGVGVAIVAVVVTAFAVQRLTEGDIRSSIERDLDVELLIRDSVSFYGLENGTWDGVQTEIMQLAVDTGERIAVATLDGDILADSEVLLFDRDAPLPGQALIVDPNSSLITFALPDDIFFELEQEGLVVADCLDTIGVPSMEFIDPDFGFLSVIPARALTASEQAQAAQCLEDFGLFDAQVLLDPEFFGEEFEGGEDFEGFVDDPFGDEFFTDLDPIQLFVGYGDGRDEGLFPSLNSGKFLIAVLGVLAVAAALTIWMATRLTKPLDRLTGAARGMTAGNLSTRVEVEGVDEIGQLGRAFNEMAESLQAEDQARRTLTTDVAHELRSPLANLRGYLEAIQDGVVQPDTATISSLHEETTLMQALVEDLQQLSLAEAGRLTLHRERTDVGDLIERVVLSHQGAASAKEVRLTAHTQPDTLLALDPDRMRQVLTNLISNAIRHTPTDGHVGVVLSTRGADVRIEVRDTGEGIGAEHLPHLFDRFYRADSSRTRASGGTGLGLAITRELVHAHGGSIMVNSELGTGTTFVLELPQTNQ